MVTSLTIVDASGFGGLTLSVGIVGGMHNGIILE